MHSCDVLIVGGGPAGSACAWKLARSGFDVAILDRARFPRDKVCGGWITPKFWGGSKSKTMAACCSPLFRSASA